MSVHRARPSPDIQAPLKISRKEEKPILFSNESGYITLQFNLSYKFTEKA